MTTTPNTPLNDAAPERPYAYPAMSFFLIIAFAVAAVIGVFAFTGHYIDDSIKYQTSSMQQSLASHGIEADGILAQQVSEGCRYKRGGYPTSTTIVHDYEGKKSSITFMCDTSMRISDFAAIPTP